MAEELSECNQTWDEWQKMREEDGRCYGVIDGRVYENTPVGTSWEYLEMGISIEQLETEWEIY
jgi:hypothetical protein